MSCSLNLSFLFYQCLYLSFTFFLFFLTHIYILYIFHPAFSYRNYFRSPSFHTLTWLSFSHNVTLFYCLIYHFLGLAFHTKVAPKIFHSCASHLFFNVFTSFALNTSTIFFTFFHQMFYILSSSIAYCTPFISLFYQNIYF